MIVFIVVGVIFAVIGVIVMLTAHGKKVRCTSVTNAKVVDIVKSVTKDYSSRRNYTGNGITINVGNASFSNGAHTHAYNTTTFYPLLEYTVDGIKYVRKSGIGSSSPQYGIGEEIEIHYNASNPNEFYTGKGNASMMVGMILTIFGILFIAIYLVMQLAA